MDSDDDVYFQLQIEEAIKLSNQKDSLRVQKRNSQESAFFTDDKICSPSENSERKSLTMNKPLVSNNKYGGFSNSSTVRTGYASRPTIPQTTAIPSSFISSSSSSNKPPDRTVGPSNTFSNSYSSNNLSSNIRCFGDFLSSNSKPSATSTTTTNATNTSKAICHTCQKAINDTPLSAMDRIFHRFCFKCHRCQKLISDNSFVPYGTPPHPFHAVCAQEQLNGEFLQSQQLSASSVCFHCKKAFSMMRAVTGVLKAGASKSSLYDASGPILICEQPPRQCKYMCMLLFRGVLWGFKTTCHSFWCLNGV